MPLHRFVLIVAVFGMAWVTTLSFSLHGQPVELIIFLFAITLAAVWLGPLPGSVVTLLSLLAISFSPLPPNPAVTTLDSLVQNSLFCLLSALLITVFHNYRCALSTVTDIQQELNQAQSIGQMGSWRINIQRNELRWSDENQRIFGIPRDAPLDYETFLSVVHPEDRDYVDQQWRAALTGKPYDIEHRIMVADKVKWVRERAILEFTKNGDILGGFGLLWILLNKRAYPLRSPKASNVIPLLSSPLWTP